LEVKALTIQNMTNCIKIQECLKVIEFSKFKDMTKTFTV